MNGAYKERSGSERLKFRTSVVCGISGDLLPRARVRGCAHKPKFDRRSAGDVSIVLHAGGTALLRRAKFFDEAVAYTKRLSSVLYRLSKEAWAGHPLWSRRGAFSMSAHEAARVTVKTTAAMRSAWA